MANEDALPAKYAYAWTEDSDVPLPEFLKKVSGHLC